MAAPATAIVLPPHVAPAAAEEFEDEEPFGAVPAASRWWCKASISDSSAIIDSNDGLYDVSTHTCWFILLGEG